MGRTGVIRIVTALGLCLAATALPARDLPHIPMGLPQDTITPPIDPILGPASRDMLAVMERYLAAPPGDQATQTELEQALARADADVAAQAPGASRHRAEWLALSLWHAEAALGLPEALRRGDEAVAIERQLAVNALVFRSFFPGTEISGQIGAATSARQAAIAWALQMADAARTDGDRATADHLAMRAFFWAQTLAQGPAALASVRPLRDRDTLQRIEAMSARMAATRLLTLTLEAYSYPPEQALPAMESVTASTDLIKADIDAMLAMNLNMAAAVLPRPLDLHQVQAALPADAALIVILPDELNFTVFAISRERFHWYRSTAYMLDIDAEVERLLSGIAAWRTRSAVPIIAENETPARGMTEAAHALYLQLLAPAAPVTTGKARLLIQATGTAAHFPWQLLLTAPAAPDTPFDRMDWLIARHRLVMLPAVESLVLPPPPPAGPEGLSYLGLGAPDYAMGRGSWAERHGGAPVIPLAPLPEAADEVRAVAALYPARGALVLTGADANEGRLEDMAAEGSLPAYDILHFATHGLIWGDHPDVGESIIALSPRLDYRRPPITVDTLLSPVPDGALSESEIRLLPLRARLVILSACKTAAGQSTDRDGISGLAASFLHAGARQVMATHWPVNSDAAVDIVTAMMQADPALTDPALALQQAMLAQIARGGRRADPAYWAPFSLIGAP